MNRDFRCHCDNPKMNGYRDAFTKWCDNCGENTGLGGGYDDGQKQYFNNMIDRIKADYVKRNTGYTLVGGVKYTNK